VRLSDHSIGIKQPLPKVVQRRTAMKDEVVAEFDLREEQPMLAARLLALFRCEEGGEPCQPFLTVNSSRGSSESASCWRRWGAEHRVNALLHCLKSIPSSRIRLASQ